MTTAQVPPKGAAPRDSHAEILEVLRQATLGEYDIVGELGRGGMAIVYLAHDIALDRKVAIKVMNPSLLMGAGMTERFKREARTAAALTHPNIIPIHVVRETDKLLFFVMKYVEGRSLDSIIAETGPLPIKMVLTILTQVGTAVGYAHRRGVVHRDVKPANILIDSEGWIVVTDFGIAKVAEAGNLTISGTTVGTPYYMSPEQCSARPVTGASDQYSLGIVGFEMVTGRPPFAGDSLMEIMRLHFFETPPPLTDVRPDCPAALAVAVERMLAKEPRQRWPSIEEAIGAAGIESLSRDDPVRTQMIAMAKSGIKPVARMSTPVSPSPLGKTFAPDAAVAAAMRKPLPSVTPIGPATPASTTPPRPPIPRKAVVWGAVAVVAAGLTFGIYRMVRVAPPETPTSTPIVPQPDAVALVEIAGAPDTIEEGQQVRLTATAKNSVGKAVVGAPIGWSSRDMAVANVSINGILTGMAAGTTTLAASSGGQSRSVQITVTRAAVASIDVLPGSVSLDVRDSIQLTAVVRDVRGKLLAGRRVAWSSRNRSVATVAENGMVKGMAPGTALLEASSEGRHGSAWITMNSPGAASVLVVPTAVTRQVGDTQRLSAVVKDSRGNPIDGARIDWTSSDPSIASVASGLVTGRAEGTVSITASSSGKNMTARVTITPPRVASIEITPESVSVRVDGTARLSAVLWDSRGNQITGRVLVWTSSKPSVVAVSVLGVITGIARGTASIEASSEGTRRSASVTVLPPAVAAIVVTPSTPTLDVGDNLPLTAVATDSRGEPVDDRRFTWLSSDSTIASISPKGVVRGIAPGRARVTAMTDGVSREVMATVLRPTPVAPGFLHMIITPVASVSIDGKSKGPRGAEGTVDTLPAGTYRLRFERTGFVTVDTTIRLQPGDVYPLRIRLIARNP